MSGAAHAEQAQFLIAIIAALIPLLIWALRDVDQRFAAKRSELLRRLDRNW